MSLAVEEQGGPFQPPTAELCRPHRPSAHVVLSASAERVVSTWKPSATLDMSIPDGTYTQSCTAQVNLPNSRNHQVSRGDDASGTSSVKTTILLLAESYAK